MTVLTYILCFAGALAVIVTVILATSQTWCAKASDFFYNHARFLTEARASFRRAHWGEE